MKEVGIKISIPEDKYSPPLTSRWINSYIDELYRPYKLFCNPRKFLFETNPKYPKYKAESKYYDGGINQMQYGKDGWVLFEPRQNELDKIEAFKAIEEKRRQLIELSNLQRKLTEKNKTSEEYLKIKKETEVLFDMIFKGLNNRDNELVEEKKITAKYYALYHWILIELGKENHFERNDKGQNNKALITQYAESKYPNISPQMFYREFIGMDITNKTAIANTFGKGYKEKLVYLSDNDSQIIGHLKNFPN